jgi:hypothetical protein
MSKQKYRVLFSPIRNPNWGCPRIAQQIALAFQIQIDKDVHGESVRGAVFNQDESRILDGYRTQSRLAGSQNPRTESVARN